MKKPARRRAQKGSDASPVKLLKSEVAGLRRELHRTLKAYGRRLENDLRKSSDGINALAPVDELSRETLHDVRDIMTLLRKRRLKPEKGRRKDLRKIESLIEDLQPFVRNGKTKSE